MKIAIPTKGTTIDAEFNPRFGRSPFFLLVDLETERGEGYPNPSVNADSGAGVQAAQFIAEHGAEAVISNNYGPKAYRTLETAGIKMFLVTDGETFGVRELLKQYREGLLPTASGPTHRGAH